MAGHNKWSKVKHIKGAADAKKGKIFSRIAKDITLAARSGGGDADMNPRLRTLLLKAREANMPSDNVDRAIKKGTGELEGQQIEEITYEGYGPGGVAFVVQVATDNKTRSASAMRSIFSKHGGNLAGSGAVMFQFLHCGQFLIGKDQTDEDTLMEVALDAGAEDIRTSDEGFEVVCPVNAFDRIAVALEGRTIKADSSEIAYVPNSTVPVTDVSAAKAILKLQAALEENEDVQNVFSNDEIPEDVAAQAHA